MKKIFALILSIVICVGCLILTSCDNNNDESTSVAEKQSVQSSVEKSSRTPVQPISNGGGFQGGDYMN